VTCCLLENDVELLRANAGTELKRRPENVQKKQKQKQKQKQK
jgi:hypothetical protein